MTSRNVRFCRGDAGQVGGIEVLPFGFLVFVSVTLLLANAWAVVDAELAVGAAAREAVRVAVESPDGATANAAATRRAHETLDAYGRGGERADVQVGGAGFARCARLTVTARYRVPVVVVPFLGGFGDLLTAEATATELVDPFRDDLPGEGPC